MKYEAVIGLEVHAQLLTETKIFCSCPNKFTSDNNRHICPVCSGMPGVLPVLNERAVRLAVLMGFATDCSIKQNSVFARKNYFYPDLPKAYQISQYDKPICSAGKIEITLPDKSKKTIRLNRIHLEEDAGKSIHDRSPDETFVDYNRCGTPLIEIVTEPDLRTPADAAAYLTKIRQMVRYLGVCDGNMEEGSLRCDANVSIRLIGESKLGTKAELKNMNSIKQVEKAIQYEIDRQIEVVESGGKIVQQTLLWDPDKGEARPMRSKEDAHDYRY
ncbi:MAG: Asp-tRNA(Asn)/Glu-tRNA(Gln) amidotransferase subunit GatB, partial [Fibrobacteres bacterium]|nr:Asp-tRNA(Asn)/Glu-tRNA(Gln) amidotransferase subunit GatB [Fibrobacterota bacterium]